MGTYASWVHGNAVTAENPELLNSSVHRGWGLDVELKINASAWFHVPIPTPVITNEARATLKQVFLLTNTLKVTLEQVVVYDGADVVQSFSGNTVTGDRRAKIDGTNTFVLYTPHTVYYGISISALYLFEFGIYDPNNGLIQFAAAGADFLV